MKNFNFKKKYGQNFLINSHIIQIISNSISPNPNDLIIEIGCGTGNLTKELKKHRSSIIGFEIDTDTKAYLNKLSDSKTTFIFDDFLKIDVKKILTQYDYENLYIIGNLPYYITTPIIEKIIRSNTNEKEIVIMIQKEVANRFTAKPKTKEYGYYTVFLNAFYDIEKVIDVTKENFNPTPKVDSTVIKLTRNYYIDENNIQIDKFITLLKDSFQFKRKKLKNNLKNYNLTIIENVLTKHGYSLDNRAEEIDLNTFVDLTKNI